jgi:methionyl-tRNA formyltransferase
MVPKLWREIAPAYGLHASLLPNYSGGAPLVWAMINGEKRTGITFFQMSDGVDAGPIVSQQEVLIKNDDTIATLYGRIENAGLNLLKNSLPSLADGTTNLIIQNEKKRKIYKQRSPEDGKICWKQSAETIERFVRAQTRPYPGAFSTLFDSEFKIWSCTINNSQFENVVEGQVIKCANGYSVVCKINSILLQDVSFNGITYRTEELDNIPQLEGQILGKT